MYRNSTAILAKILPENDYTPLRRNVLKDYRATGQLAQQKLIYEMMKLTCSDLWRRRRSPTSPHGRGALSDSVACCMMYLSVATSSSPRPSDQQRCPNCLNADPLPKIRDVIRDGARNSHASEESSCRNPRYWRRFLSYTK